METVEIQCRCKNCMHGVKKGDKLYCYWWDYETGMSPNVVDEMDFCSNADPD